MQGGEGGGGGGRGGAGGGELEGPHRLDAVSAFPQLRTHLARHFRHLPPPPPTAAEGLRCGTPPCAPPAAACARAWAVPCPAEPPPSPPLLAGIPPTPGTLRPSSPGAHSQPHANQGPRPSRSPPRPVLRLDSACTVWARRGSWPIERATSSQSMEWDTSRMVPSG